MVGSQPAGSRTGRTVTSKSHDLRNWLGLAQATSAIAGGFTRASRECRAPTGEPFAVRSQSVVMKARVVSGGSGSELRGDTSPRPAVIGNRQSNTHMHNRPAAVNSGTPPSTGPQIPWVHADALSHVSVACQVAKSVP